MERWGIDRQVLNRKNAQALGLTTYGLHDGIIGSWPDLNIVYLPEQFQACRESFDGSYLFLVPTPEAVWTDTAIPYAMSMKKWILFHCFRSKSSE